MMDNTSFILRDYKIEGRSLRVAIAGQGAPLLLIHGWANDWTGWRLLASHLAPSHRLYMVDLPGYGASQALTQYAREHVATVLRTWLHKENIQPHAVIGASLGTLLAADFMHRYPELSKKLILIGPALRCMGWKRHFIKAYTRFGYHRKWMHWSTERVIRSLLASYFMERFMNSHEFDWQKVRIHGVPGRKKINGRAYIQLGYEAFQFDLDAYLASTTTRTLLLHGTNDKHVHPAATRALAQTYPHVSTVLIPNAGHNPGYEQPQKTAATLRQFIAEQTISQSKSALLDTTPDERDGDSVEQ